MLLTFCRFNSKLGHLAQQKRIDVDRITDLGTRIDELTRELAKVNALEETTVGDSGFEAGLSAGAGAGPAALVPYWSPLEDLEEVLFTFKDGDIKVRHTACFGFATVELHKRLYTSASKSSKRTSQGCADGLVCKHQFI
jgi:hypothetical protein